MIVSGEKKLPLERAQLERLAVLLGERPRAKERRAVRANELEEAVLKIVTKWAKERGLI